MESCLNCYFAKICSENCKKQHEKNNCILQMRQNHIIKMENKLNKYDIMMQNNSIKSNLLSGDLFFSDKSSIYFF